MRPRPQLFVFLFLLLLMAQLNGSGQIFEGLTKSLKEKPKFFLTLASFNTFIDHDFASFNGLKMGVTYDKKVRFGLGYFTLANNGVVTTIDVNEVNSSYTTNGQLEVFFFNFSAEYIFFNRLPWQFSAVPFNLALGSAHYEYISRTESKRVKGPAEFLMLYQPEVTAQYNVIKWFGFGVSTGYRFAVIRSKKQTKKLDGFNFSIDFRLSIDELYYEIVSSK